LRFVRVGFVLAGLLLVAAGARAQVYTCVAKDGSRVFSDQRCGPDAKIVPGIDTGKSKAKSPAGSRPVKTQRTAAELERLTEKCDAGDLKACTEWTLGGGPNLLRENERRAEQECEAGSLRACEERYCREAIDADCRARVQRTAQLAGDTWYLREQMQREDDGTTRYAIRCIPPGVHESRDITVTCSALAGPNRCYSSDQQQGFARLANAAAAQCSARAKPDLALEN
jgi:Domain of unknown function (DUF4124)